MGALRCRDDDLRDATLIREAKRYVGTTVISGAAQMGLLLREGLRRTDRVLEYGAGCLHLGRFLIPWLPERHYFAVEPNRWLIEAGVHEEPGLTRFSWRTTERDDFDATEFGRGFEVIFAHSVLSHTAGWQVRQLLAAARAVALPDALLVVSYRSGWDSGADEWVYPSVTFLSDTTLLRTAEETGWRMELRPDLRRWYSTLNPDEVHDWAVARAR